MINPYKVLCKQIEAFILCGKKYDGEVEKLISV